MEKAWIVTEWTWFPPDPEHGISGEYIPVSKTYASEDEAEKAFKDAVVTDDVPEIDLEMCELDEWGHPHDRVAYRWKD